jgi:hypothetical protein
MRRPALASSAAGAQRGYTQLRADRDEAQEGAITSSNLTFTVTTRKPNDDRRATELVTAPAGRPDARLMQERAFL